MNGTNLIPPERMASKRRRLRLRAWVLACCLYGVALAAGVAAGYSLYCRDDRQAVSELESLSRQAQATTNTIRDLQDSLAKAQAALDVSREIGSRPDWSYLLVALAGQLGDEVVLNGCRLEPCGPGRDGPAGASAGAEQGSSLALREYELTLNGYGQSQAAISQFVLRLEGIDLFRQVRLTKSNRQPFMGGEAVAFCIACLI